jgi:hypothetical protein
LADISGRQLRARTGPRRSKDFGEVVATNSATDGGADPRAPNRNGSTPMLLANQNTGKSGSGSTEAKAQQNKILRLLEEHGAT